MLLLGQTLKSADNSISWEVAQGKPTPFDSPSSLELAVLTNIYSFKLKHSTGKL